MESTFPNWKKAVILRVLKVAKAVERDMEEEPPRFRENEDLSDLLTLLRPIKSWFIKFWSEQPGKKKKGGKVDES